MTGEGGRAWVGLGGGPAGSKARVVRCRHHYLPPVPLLCQHQRLRHLLDCGGDTGGRRTAQQRGVLPGGAGEHGERWWRGPGEAESFSARSWRWGEISPSQTTLTWYWPLSQVGFIPNFPPLPHSPDDFGMTWKAPKSGPSGYRSLKVSKNQITFGPPGPV